MVSLLDETLTEILISLSDDDCAETTAKNVEKFMLSGIQPFDIAANYFKVANEAFIKPKCFGLFVKEKQWTFSHNFLFASFLSQILTLQKIKIEFSQESVVLDNFLINGFKEVYIFGDINEKYLNQLHLLTSLTNVEIERCKMRFQDLSLIQRIKTKLCPNIDYHEIIKSNPKNMCFPNVQDLALQGRYMPSDVTLESLKQFYTNIFTIFPQMQKLSACYTTANSSWQEIFNIMNSLTYDIFANIVTNAVGEIRFDYSEWNILLPEVIAKINEKMNNEIEKNDCILKRTIQIKHNLYFTFSLYFRRSERRRRRFK